MKRTSLPLQRREFIAGLAGVAACPLATQAQQPDRVRRIGVLMGNAEGDDEGESGVAAFRDELRKAGWTERRNVHIETRRAKLSGGGARKIGGADLWNFQLDPVSFAAWAGKKKQVISSSTFFEGSTSICRVALSGRMHSHYTSPFRSAC